MVKEKSLRTIYNEKRQVLQKQLDYLMELETNPRLLRLLKYEKDDCLWIELFKSKKERLIYNTWKEYYEAAQKKLIQLIDEFNEAEANYKQRKKEK